MAVHHDLVPDEGELVKEIEIKLMHEVVVVMVVPDLF